MRQLSYIFSLSRFALRANPLFHLSIGISLLSVVIEVLAMSSLLPLVSMVSGNASPGTDPVSRGLGWLGIPINSDTLVWTFLVLLFLRLATLLLSQTLAVYLSRRVMAQIGATAFDQVSRHIGLAEINRHSMGHYMALAGDEAFRASVVLVALTQFLGTVALCLLYFAAIASFSPPTALLIAGFLAVSSLAVLRIVEVSRRLGARQVTESRVASSVFLDTLNNLKAVRALSAEVYVANLYRRLIHGYSRTWFWIDEVAVLTRLLPVLLMLGAAGAWLLFSDTALEEIGLPFVVTLIAFLTRFFPTLGQGVNLFMKIATEARSGKEITEILDRPVPAPLPGRLPHAQLCSLSVSGLHFHHEGTPEREILQGLDVAFERGHSYAVSAPSGAGKSTLVDLLVKFYDPVAGAILLDGVPLAELDAAIVRRHIVVVSQDAALFNDTIANNIRLGLESSDQQLVEACRHACIDDFIRQLPGGYDSLIQYNGNNLSGGQRQRIAIARALLRDPDVIMLDESTNALDKGIQRAIVDNILRLYRDRIAIFITHDPDITGRVDRVIELVAPTPPPSVTPVRQE